MGTDRKGKPIEMITVFLPLRKEKPKSRILTSRNVSYSHRDRMPAGRKQGERFKESQEHNSECISIYSVLSSPGSRTRKIQEQGK